LAAGVLTRAGDAASQIARFIVAAQIAGVALTTDQAVLAGTVYFVIGTFAPTGSLGVREAGTAGALAFMSSEQFAVVVLMVSASEIAVSLAGAGLGVVWLWGLSPRPGGGRRERGTAQPLAD
ncbi:MAG: hypothetical protein H7Y88_11105, partial [Phycisphaerales bacterium]|nr:hypothetical protein [Phycisphaerales bacterium]